VFDRLREVAGVAAVSAAEDTVLSRVRYNVPVPGNARETIDATMAAVAPGFFETMQIPLLAGRTFVRGDLLTERPTVVIVNESFARRYFGGEPAVGRRFEGRIAGSLAHEVIGVVADARYDLRKPPAPTIYILVPIRTLGTLHVRVAGDARAIAYRIREEVPAATPLFE
jgi:putative ABC transport system permease protein